MKIIICVVSVLIMVSCTSKTIDAEFIEIKNNIARFDVFNNSDNDIRKITFQVRFLDNSNNILLTDTLSYKMSDNYQNENLPFLKANDETFIVQSIPENCTKADIKVLEFDNLK